MTHLVRNSCKTLLYSINSCFFTVEKEAALEETHRVMRFVLLSCSSRLSCSIHFFSSLVTTALTSWLFFMSKSLSFSLCVCVYLYTQPHAHTCVCVGKVYHQRYLCMELPMEVVLNLNIKRIFRRCEPLILISVS